MRTHKLRHHTIVAGWLLLGLSIIWGCGASAGPELSQVQGVVTLDGTPLANANVEFRGPEGATSFGRTDTNGHYELVFAGDQKGTVVGHHTVRIRVPSPEDETAAGDWKPLPARYNTESELTADVQAGPNTFDFPLESQ